MREPLLLPLLAVASGILLAELLSLSVPETVGAALGFTMLACVPASRWLRGVCIGLALIFAGAFLLAWHRPTEEPYIDAGPREVMQVSGCVVVPTVFSGDGSEFTLELALGARALVRLPNYDPEKPPPVLAYGQRVEVEARIRPPRNFGNPGAFDYKTYLARRGIYWTAQVPTHGAVRILDGECGSSLKARLEGALMAVRGAGLRRIDRLFPPDADGFHGAFHGAMLKAVLLGESDYLERVWKDDFRESGTYHALVISGLHVSVLAGLLLFLFRFVPIRPGAAFAVTAAIAWDYAILAGFSPPVVRAAAGLTMYLAARLLFRRTRVLNLLAAIALVFLAVDPYQLFEASFQLSFLAVAAIGALAAPLMERTTGAWGFALRNITREEMDVHLEPRLAALRVELRLIAETLGMAVRGLVPVKRVAQTLAIFLRIVLFAVELGVISVAIQIGLALPMAEYFHRISFTGLSANLLMIPLMNLIVPVGFLALATGWQWVGSLAGHLLDAAYAVARWHADLDPGWRVPDPPVWLAIAYVTALIGGALLIRRQRLGWPVKGLIAGLFVLLIWSPWPPLLQPGVLELTAIDVGQGDSLLAVFPEGATMLIDGGGRPDFRIDNRAVASESGLDIGEEVVSPYLWSRGMTRLDIVVATHADADHTGGLAAILRDFRPRELWVGVHPPEALMAQAKELGIEVRRRVAGAPEEFSGGTVQVLAPMEGFAFAKPGNNDSLVLRLSLGERSFLLTGDVEDVMERRLVSSGEIRHADVLKVAHHGSKTSTTETFLSAVSPSIAMISAGYANSYGHPHPDVLTRLEAHHVPVLRTDAGGMASVFTDGKDLWFQAEGTGRAFDGTMGGLRISERRENYMFRMGHAAS